MYYICVKFKCINDIFVVNRIGIPSLITALFKLYLFKKNIYKFYEKDKFDFIRIERGIKNNEQYFVF